MSDDHGKEVEAARKILEEIAHNVVGFGDAEMIRTAWNLRPFDMAKEIDRPYEFNTKAEDVLKSPSDPQSEGVYEKLRNVEPFSFKVKEGEEEVTKFTCTSAALILKAVAAKCTGRETVNNRMKYSTLLKDIDPDFDLSVNFLGGLIKAIKERFIQLNDYFRFSDSPKVRDDVDTRRRIAAGGQGQQLFEGTAPSTNQDLGPRTIQPNSRLQDHINPSPASIRQYQSDTRSTDYRFGPDIYNPAGTDIPSMFPNFDQIINQIQNQPDVMKELAKALKHQLQEATTERNRLKVLKDKLAEQVPVYFSAVEGVIRSHNIAREYLKGLLVVARDTNTPLDNAAGPITPAPEEEAAEEQQEEPSLPAETTSAGTANKSYIDRVRGKGYLGVEMEISRLHVCKDDPLEYENCPSADREMPAGVYFFKNEFLLLCGYLFTNNADEPFPKELKNVLNTRGALGRQGYSLGKDYLIAKLVPSQSRDMFCQYHPGGGDPERIVLVPEEHVKGVFNTKIKSMLDELAPGRHNEDDPFVDSGCLAWVLKGSPDGALLVSDIDSWEKCQYEKSKTSKKRRRAQSEGVVTGTEGRVGRGDPGEGGGEEMGASMEVQGEASVEGMDDT